MEEWRVLRFLVRRLLLTLPVLLGVATLVFALIHLIPGDPAQAMLGETASEEEVAALRDAPRPRPSAARAVRRLPAGRRPRRPRHVAAQQRAGGPGDHRSAAGDSRARGRRDVRGDRRLDPARDHCRGAPRHDRRPCGDDAGAGRDFDPELLARAAAGAGVRRRARMAAGFGTRDAREPGAAGDLARRRAGGDPGADDARVAARGAARALRAGGARPRRLARRARSSGTPSGTA